MALSLAQIRADVRDDVARATVDTLLVTDQLLAAVPLMPTRNGSLFSYVRKIVNPASAFAARGASISDTDALVEVEVMAKTKRIVVQQSVDRSDGIDAGGLGAVKARKTVAAIESIGLTIGQKLLTGDSNLTGALVGDGTLTSATYCSVTDVGPNIITDRGQGLLRYTHSTTSFAFRAPGSYDFGPEATVAAGSVGKVYGHNRDQWIEVTRGVGVLSADSSAAVTFSGGTSEFDGVFALLKGQTSRIIYANSDATNGANISLADLDRLEKLVKAPKAQKVFICGDRTMSSIEALMRAAGGATMMEYAGTQVQSYKGIPILYSDYMPITQTRGSASTCSSVICTTFGEDGGLCAFYTPEDPEPVANAIRVDTGVMGINTYDLGISGTAHKNTVRVVTHVALANPNTIKIAQLGGVLN
mgnify:CR=1 FL=1